MDDKTIIFLEPGSAEVFSSFVGKLKIDKIAIYSATSDNNSVFQKNNRWVNTTKRLFIWGIMGKTQP